MTPTAASIKFQTFEFSVTVLTESGVITAADFQIEETTSGLVARSTAQTLFGDDRRPVDAYITLTLENTKEAGVRWQASATAEARIKGIKVHIAPVPGTAIIISGGNEIEVGDGQAAATGFPGPSSWHTPIRIPQSGVHFARQSGAQQLLIKGPDSLWMLSSDDYPPRFQRFWAFRTGAQLALTVYLEANNYDRQPELATPYWTLGPVSDAETGMRSHMQWVEEAYGLQPFSQRSDVPDWAHDISLNITFHCHANHGRVNVTFADIEAVLENAAVRFDPANTQLHIVGWDGPWDLTWPAFEPGSALGGPKGFLQLMQTTRRLGYKVGLHMNVMGLSYQHPEFESIEHFLQYQCRDAEARPLNWEHDIDGDDQDEPIFAYISPDAAEWRDYLVERILKFVDTYKTDIVHLDQSTTFINDQNFDHLRGVNALFRDLRARLPEQVALSGEYTSEAVIHLYPLCGYFPLGNPDLQRHLFMPYIRAFNYGYPPEPTRESLLYDSFGTSKWEQDAFYKDLQAAEQAGLIPTLLVGKPDLDLESDEAAAVFAAAERFLEQIRFEA